MTTALCISFALVQGLVPVKKQLEVFALQTLTNLMMLHEELALEAKAFVAGVYSGAFASLELSNLCLQRSSALQHFANHIHKSSATNSSNIRPVRLSRQISLDRRV